MAILDSDFNILSLVSIYMPDCTLPQVDSATHESGITSSHRAYCGETGPTFFCLRDLDNALR